MAVVDNCCIAVTVVEIVSASDGLEVTKTASVLDNNNNGNNNNNSNSNTGNNNNGSNHRGNEEPGKSNNNNSNNNKPDTKRQRRLEESAEGKTENKQLQTQPVSQNGIMTRARAAAAAVKRKAQKVLQQTQKRFRGSKGGKNRHRITLKKKRNHKKNKIQMKGNHKKSNKKITMMK